MGTVLPVWCGEAQAFGPHLCPPYSSKLTFMDASKASLAPGTSASPAQPNVLRYLVKAKDTTVILTPHVNHRVEVTGVVSGLAESNPTAPPQPVAPTLTVATVKMISTECLSSARDRD